MTRGKKYHSTGTLYTILLIKTHMQHVPYKTQPNTVNHVFHFYIFRDTKNVIHNV